MGKTKLAVYLAAAYAFGLALLVAVGLALPCETLPRVRMALARVPEVGHRAVQLVRVAAHAGSLGVRHLPALLDPQGAQVRQRTSRFCLREPQAGCGSSATPTPSLAEPVLHLLLDDT